MTVYKKRGTFLQELHPIPAVLIILTYIVGFIIINNPIYMVVVALSLIVMATIDGCLKELMKYAVLIMPFAIFMVILNPLIVKNGSTVLYEGRINIPVLGPVRVTLEAIAYGLFSSLRIICVTMAFGFGNLIIHPDRSFSFFSRYVKNSALLMSMTLNLFPRLARNYNEISDIERLRGNCMEKKNMKDKVKSQGNIINILFLSSLEDSMETAESIYSRGYGIGSRSVYFHEKIGFYDRVFSCISISIIVAMSLVYSAGLDTMEFYPKMQNPLKNLSLIGVGMCVLFYIPSFIIWGCGKWRY